ncbi:TPA: hypothetical protein ACJ8X2_001894 [Streptococcus pneumoniae]
MAQKLTKLKDIFKHVSRSIRVLEVLVVQEIVGAQKPYIQHL